jgi:hypothetical protein
MANMKPRAALHQSAPKAKARAISDQRVMGEAQTLTQRHADMIHEFQGCCAGAAFCAVNHNEIRRDASFNHRLANGEELPWMADAKLEARRLAAG